MTEELIAFVKARLDEWERLARQALPVQTGSRDEGQPVEHVSWRRGPGSVEFGLRHVATLRKIVADCERAMSTQAEFNAAHARYGSPFPSPHANLAFRALLQLAADWPTHRDYRAEWALDDHRA